MTNGFEKITPVNGFDSENINNAMQNNSASCFKEFGDYIYVGTARNLIYDMLKSNFPGELNLPDVLIPKEIDSLAEIWRCKKDGSENWERAFKSTEELSINKIMFMFIETPRNGNSILYAAATAKNGLIILRTTDGKAWGTVTTGINESIYSASLAIHDRKYYISLFSKASTPIIYATDNLESEWTKIALYGDMNPGGSIMKLLSFNGHLYAACAVPDGFEVWRTRGRVPYAGGWKLILNKGAGNESNEYPLSMTTFKNNIFIGTANFPFRSMDTDKGLIMPKGFDLIRINKSDRWSIVIGGTQEKKRHETSQKIHPSESGLASGFNKMTNTFCTGLTASESKMYLGTLNWSTIIPAMVSTLKDIFMPKIFVGSQQNAKWSSLIDSMVTSIFSMLTSYGFDLWETGDGVNWNPITKTGFSTSENLGVSNIFIASDDTIYIGTFNPFKGCEIWSKRKGHSPDTVRQNLMLFPRH